MTNDQQQLGGAQAAAKKKATGSSPDREYVVTRDIASPGGDSETGRQVEIVGRFKGTTSKQARINAAKSGRIDKVDLEKGVRLRAIAASAFDADKDAPPVKLEVREEFSA